MCWVGMIERNRTIGSEEYKNKQHKDGTSYYHPDHHNYYNIPIFFFHLDIYNTSLSPMIV